MPESPEVDALAGFLRAQLPGRIIREVALEEFRALKTRDRPLTELSGRAVTGVRRFGKHIALDTSGGGDEVSLLISFGRAGWARWYPDGRADDLPEAPTIVRVHFGDGAQLALTDAGDWLSLGVSVTADAESDPHVAKLGPDPMTDAFTRETLDGIVAGRRKQLKALLQEQESLAGIGNAYSDEILHVARLAPGVHASALTATERGRLFEAITRTLGEAFEARRDVPIAEQKAAKVAAMRVHGRTGQACPECGGLVEDVPGSKGAAQWCPACQGGSAQA